MRRFLALTMVAALTLSLSLAVMGCGGGQQANEGVTPPAETTWPPPEGGAPDTAMMADTSMAEGH